MDFVHFVHSEDSFGMLFKIFSYQFISQNRGKTYTFAAARCGKKKKNERAEATLPYIKIKIDLYFALIVS